MEQPCIMTLDPVAGIITSREDIVAYLIRQLFGNPGGTSDVYEQGLLSFNKLSAKYNDDQEQLKFSVQNNLADAIRKYFPTNEISVDCNLAQIQQRVFTLEIRVLIRDKYGITKPLLTEANVKLQEGSFIINFKGA